MRQNARTFFDNIKHIVVFFKTIIDCFDNLTLN